MTPSYTEFDSEEASQDEGEAKSSITLSISPMDHLAHRWGIKAIKAIYKEGLEPKVQGKPVRSIYKDSRLIDTIVSHVAGQGDDIRQHGFRWLTVKLRKYSTLMVRV